MGVSKHALNGSRFAEGPKNARVMLVGQNPGREEVKQGRPFVGMAGKYLNRVLKEKGIDRKQLYLTCVVKEPTPKNRKPASDEINRWMPDLVREIKEIDPWIMVLMGRVAWNTPRSEKIEYVETYHPAAAMRFPKVRQKFEKDIETLSRIMQRRGLSVMEQIPHVPG
ncbi:MAG: uracil-DNA glycosylase [Deltaproteobacteria bacterium]|nr:uracil-DNA glycosylase [Deltaproteobacteria bacterium]